MAPKKTTRGGISLRRRVTAWLAAILLVTMLSNGIATVVGQWAVRAFDALLADNAACSRRARACLAAAAALARENAAILQSAADTERLFRMTQALTQAVLVPSAPQNPRRACDRSSPKR